MIGDRVVALPGLFAQHSYLDVAAPDLSGPTLIVRRMNDWDAIDSGDAALRELLATAAEHTVNPNHRKLLLDFLIDMPPLTEWSEMDRGMLTQTCAYITSLARLNRELEQLQDATDD